MASFKHPSHRPHRYSDLGTRLEWESAARQLLDEGQAFLACDLARKGLERYPESRALLKTVARGLIRVGARDDARALLEPVVSTIENDAEQPQATGEPPDEEIFGMLARIYKDEWRRSGDLSLAQRSRDLYHYSYQVTGGYYTGINAATLSCILGERDASRKLAGAVHDQCVISEPSAESDYWRLATMGEALLLLGEGDQAAQRYREAAAVASGRHARIVSSLEQIRLLQKHGVPVPDAIFEALKPPEIVIFVGHMIDAPDRPVPRFPPHLEGQVRAAIDRRLAELGVCIGYCSAACGSDILFIEAMLARGAEVNIILPFAEEDFLKQSVAFAGEEWMARYRNALERARSVSFLTEEPFLGDTVLFDYITRISHGYAELRASALLTEPLLLAVWDGNPVGPLGGTADFLSRWPDPNRRSVIRLDRLTQPSGSPVRADATRPSKAAPNIPVETERGLRQVRTMLFADVVGYSKLDEARIPGFLHEFWSKVAERLTPKPSFINTWGDAIFAVMDTCLPMMEFALSLQAAVKETVWADSGVPDGIDVRIGLHVGPIYEAIDPLTGRTNFYGSHVNRTARLEPVTVPGHIYATETFVALLMSEMSASRVAARERNERVEFPFTWEYVGILALAKDFGEQAAYHIRRARQH